MNEQSLDAFTHHAGEALSRRRSLGTLGVAAFLAAMATPAVGLAAKSNKKAKRKARKLKTKKCKKQEGPCRDFWTGVCEGDPECEPLIDCCASFASCNTDAALSCMLPPPRQPV
jgi:hypothetical protein